MSYTNNYSSSLDVSTNTALEVLSVSTNYIKTLDLSNNTALLELHAANNKLTELDLTNNPHLFRLYLSINSITSLDVSKNTVLTGLHCSRNSITHLDVSSNTQLVSLNCFSNALTSLDLSKNTLIKNLQTYDNEIEVLDLSTLGKLEFFEAHNSKLTSLNLANGNNSKVYVYNTQNNPDLKCIHVDDTLFSKTKWTKVDSASSFSLNCSGGNTSIGNYKSEQVVIYPNPTHGKLTIEANNNVATSIKVLTLLGATIMELEGNTDTLDVSALPKGMYFLQVNYTNSTATSRFIKE